MSWTLLIAFLIVVIPINYSFVPVGQDGKWQVIFTNISGYSNAVPGKPGVFFQPGTSTTHFDRIFSNSGEHWILTANNDPALLNFGN